MEASLRHRRQEEDGEDHRRRRQEDCRRQEEEYQEDQEDSHRQVDSHRQEGGVRGRHQEEDYSPQVHRLLVDHPQHGDYHRSRMSRPNQVQK